MDIIDIALDDLITISLIIAQAGILYYRLKKVEQRTDLFNDLMIEFAVHKKTLQLHREESEKQSARTEIILQRLDTRLSSMESQALKAFIQQGHS